MSMLKFNDGEEFDTSGEYRVELRSDGWYILGKGILWPVHSKEEGVKVIERLTKKGEADGKVDQL